MTLDTQDFVKKYGPVTLILGGSEGIGRQFAEQLAAASVDLVRVARSSEPPRGCSGADPGGPRRGGAYADA